MSSVPSPETNTASAPVSNPKQVAESVYTYAVSWTWLLLGLVGMSGLCGIVGAAYYFQTQNMAAKILEVVDDMVKESERLKAEVSQVDDPERKGELIDGSIKSRTDAANLLNTYRRQNMDAPSETILKKLYDILESLYEDYGGATSVPGLQYGEQLRTLAVELTRIVSQEESIKYYTRLLELEWDRRYLAGIIRQGDELLKQTQKVVDGGENSNAKYTAVRYMALAFYDNLSVESYNPGTYSLPSSVFPETMDELLESLYSQKPDDIEIAKRYAEFLVTLDHQDQTRRNRFSGCASEALRNRSKDERLTAAKRIIDNMVQRNQDNPTAYLTRYHFNSAYSPQGEGALDQANPDLITVLRLAPGNSEALILSSIDALKQADIAARNGEQERALKWRTQAEDYLRRTVKENSADPFGYQYLGDYLLFVKREPKQAIEVWNNGLNNAHFRGSEELIGRLIVVLLEQRMVEEAREKLELLNQALPEIRLSRPDDFKRTDDMRLLLSAQLANTEANIAASRVEAAQRASRPDEVRRLFNIVQTKKSEAVQTFEHVLYNWGRDMNDYIVLNEKRSVFSILLPESLLQLGDLKLDRGESDVAITYFERASRIPSAGIQKAAFLKLSVALQQSGQLDRAAQVLKTVVDRYPDDLATRSAYATLLFRSQVASNTARLDTLDEVERELRTLGQHRNELTQPWTLDIRLIHLDVVRANLSGDADAILEAMQEATRKFRALEKETFPPDADGNTKDYMSDPAFVAELAGIYSSFAARDDFDRLLQKLREFPEGGEEAYYEVRINDSLRRDDREGAIAIIDEANASPLLSDARKERFVALLQSLRGENTENALTLDNVYLKLKTTFDENPESLKPQAFFLLAEMSLDRGQPEQAKLISEHLRKIEGSTGTMWRYITVRLMLGEKDPDYDAMRKMQEEVAGLRPTWDRSFILRALIEEHYLAANPEDPATVAALIGAYRAATRAGSVRPDIWQRFIGLLEIAGRTDDAKEVIREAALKGVMLEARTNQLPQPYGRMYTQVQEALANEDATYADTIAKQCMVLAERRGEREELKSTLNLQFGKVFLDSLMFESAERHLSETARRGGTFVYPLAICVAKSGKVDEGFNMLLDEIDLVPAALPSLLPAVLVLLAQVQPSEAVYDRIDRLMERIEKGDREPIHGTLEASNEDNVVSFGSNRMPSRKIRSFVLRFPGNTENFDPSLIQFVAPEELESGKPAEQPSQQP